MGFLIKMTGAPVYPCYIDGAFEAWPRDARVPRPRTIRVIYGTPVTLPEDLKLTPAQHNDIDYANCLVGDRAGTADITAINTAELGKVTVLWSFPEKVGETIEMPSDFRFFIVVPDVPRLDGEGSQLPAITNYAAYIKSMTGMGYDLAALWLQHLAREGLNLGQAIVDLQLWAWAKDWGTLVVEEFKDLIQGLAEFLKIPPASRRVWEGWIESVSASIQA